MSELTGAFERFIRGLGYVLSERDMELARLVWNTAVSEAIDHVDQEEGCIFHLDDLCVLTPDETKAAEERLKAESFARDHTIVPEDEIDELPFNELRETR